MEIYLVGGAVRDKLLDLPVDERDWVVVGGSAEALERLGYRSVGRDFPVFLHPETQEEFALARTERKTGKGHTGFECDTEAVSLEDDLKRRDLTINAIAEAEDGTLVDPYGGVADLDHRVLRHVSAAFEEDPLRVLRVARFAARFASLGFRIAPETLTLMKDMVARGDLAELAPERIWQEIDKVLPGPSPEIFFTVLVDVGAAGSLWPEIPDLAIVRLGRVARLTQDPLDRMAALLLDLEDGAISGLCQRLRMPNKVRDFSRLVARCNDSWLAADSMNATQKLELLYRADAFRHPGRFRQANQLLARVHGAQSTSERWIAWLDAASTVTVADIPDNLKGDAIGQAIRAEQAKRIAARGS